MGRKKKDGGGVTEAQVRGPLCLHLGAAEHATRPPTLRAPLSLLPQPFCYYCDRGFDNEAVLIQHQKSRHFKCDACGKKMTGLGALITHARHVHKDVRCSAQTGIVVAARECSKLAPTAAPPPVSRSLVRAPSRRL